MTNPHLKVGQVFQNKELGKRSIYGDATIVAFGNRNVIYVRDGIEYSGSLSSFFATYELKPVKRFLYESKHSDARLFISEDVLVGYRYVGEVIDYQGKDQS